MADDVVRFFIFLLHLINKYVHCSVINAHQQIHIIGQYFSWVMETLLFCKG